MESGDDALDTVGEAEFFEGFVNEDEDDAEDDNEDISRVISPKFNSVELKTDVDPVGKARLGNEVDAHRLWIMKCLLTERYKYLAYDTDFGVGINEILESDDDKDVIESEIEREIIEALEVDERTSSVEDFSFAWRGDEIQVEFVVESIYENEDIVVLTGGDEGGRGVFFRTS